MERRSEGRWLRRLSVRFWPRDDEKPRQGHTVNLSSGGAFIGTYRPPVSGTRIRVEVLDRERGFVSEAVVTHSRNVAPELRKVQEPGMGVRFLTPAELVKPLRPKKQELATPEADAEPAPVAPPVRHSDRTYSIRFSSLEQLREVYHRDLAHGGLFIATRHPAALDQVVSLAIEPPGESSRAIVVSARVVHRFDPVEHAGSAGDERMAGMGVELIHPERVLEELAPLLEE